MNLLIKYIFLICKGDNIYISSHLKIIDKLTMQYDGSVIVGHNNKVAASPVEILCKYTMKKKLI